MAAGVESGQDPLHRRRVARFGRSDEVVVSQAEFRGEALPILRQFIAIRLRVLIQLLGSLLHLLAVLIQAGQKKNFLVQAAMSAGHDVGQNLLVSMAQMRLAIDVVNGGGDKKRFTHAPTGFWLSEPELAMMRMGEGRWIAHCSLRIAYYVLVRVAKRRKGTNEK